MSSNPLSPPLFFFSGIAKYIQCLTQKNWITSSTKINITVYFCYTPQLDISKQLDRKHCILKVENIKSLWLCYHSNKLNLTMVRETLANKVVVGLLSFLIVWISDTINMLLLFFSIQTQNECTCCMQEGKHLNNIWVTFLFKCGKAIFWWSRRPKSQKISYLQGILTLAN